MFSNTGLVEKDLVKKGLVETKLFGSAEKGFTLIEMMIVIAIIGVLAAIALPAYQDYIKTTNLTKVMAHFEEAKRLTENTYVKGHVQGTLAVASTVPASTAEWIAVYNSGGSLAPGGGNAYVSGAGDSTSGQIGVTASGTFPDTAQVTLTLPAYSGLTAKSTTITSASSL